MTFEQAKQFIVSRGKFGTNLGLARVTEILERLGSPHEKLKVVHVAGTNGKGSTCAMVAAILQASGLKVGRFSSPAVVDFREQIQINGEMIMPEAFAQIFARILPHIMAMDQVEMRLTEFEIVTALALEFFAQEGCDVVVLEVGLGGRLDATNAVKHPLASVITSISLDHTEILGDTLEAIAAEKAAIIKPGRPVVVFPLQPHQGISVIKDGAMRANSPVSVPKLEELKILRETAMGSRFMYKGQEFFVPMCGRHQVLNALVAIETTKLLQGYGFRLTADDIKVGLSRAFIPARGEIFSIRPLVMLDGAHNPGSAEVLRATLGVLAPERPRLILGILTEKDICGVLRVLAPCFEEVVCVDVPNLRALPAEKLAKIAKNFHPKVSTDSLEVALQRAANGSFVVCGSLYLATAARPILLKMQREEKFVCPSL